MWKHILWAIVQCGSLSVLRNSNVKGRPMGSRPMWKSFDIEVFGCKSRPMHALKVEASDN